MDTIVQTLNTAGRAFVHFALPMLLQSSLLILLLLAVDTLLRRRVRAVFRYWIWMLVLVKLVLPPSLWSPVSIGTWVGDELQVPTAALLESEPAPPAEAPPAGRPSPAAYILSAPDPLFAPDREPRTEDVAPPAPPLAASEPTPTGPAGPTLTWQGFVLLLWGMTVVVLLLLLLQRAYFVQGLVAQAEPADQKMLGVLEGCRAHLGLRRAVALRISPNATSPAVCGLRRPTILIPQNLAPRLQGRDLRAVFLHELAHIRRGDLWVNLVQTLLQIAYFYHPLLWLANAVMRRAREQAVDETVLVALGETAAQYPETLVNVAKLAFRRRPVLSLRLVGVVESKSALSARIKHMLRRPLPRTAKLGLLGLLMVVATAAILLPMAAAAERPLSESRTGPLEVRFVGVCPDQSGDILDATGKKVEEMPYPLAGRPVWQPDRLRRDFVFEVPETPEPALFVRYRFDGPAGWWQQADRTPLAPVRVSGRRLLFVSEELPRVWRKPILGILPRNIPLDKMDITLGYFYGPPRRTRLSFAGPFQEEQTVPAAGGAEGQLTVLAPQPVMPQSEPRPRFRLQAPVVTDAHAMIVLYDTGGARHIAGWMRGRLPKDPDTTVDFSPDDEGLTLPQIARIAVEEPYELTVRNVRVDYPNRPARDHAAYLDVMAERLGLTTLPPEELAKYKFANPQDAIAVIDILPAGDLARRAVGAITSGQPRVNLAKVDGSTRDKLYAVAQKWADSSDLPMRVLGVRLGLLGDRPEFFTRAVTLLEDDYHNLADTGSIQNDLDQLVWPLLNRHRAELTPQQRSDLSLYQKGRRMLPILGSADRMTAPGTTGDPAVDSDDDGLSDFQEVHKYLTDPTKKDSDGDGTPDGDWNERREYAYSVRTVLRYLPPFDDKGLNDDFQDARVLKQTDEYIEIEVIHYPLATGYDSVPENANWRRDDARDARLAEYLAPGVTTNWDEPMRRDLLAALKADGIDVETLTDKQVVERVSSWLLKRSRYLDNVFTTYYVDFPQGKPRVYPGLEDAFQHEFERDSRNYDWTIEQHLDHEVLGKGMFYNKTHGSCTSTAVYLTTVLRALGIPTRIVLATAAVDGSDRAQVLMVKNAITHNRVRVTMLAGLGWASHGFCNHTFNEVYVGNRWCRLDYTQLGCSSLGERRFGLQTHLYTCNDLSDVNFAPTWGRRYAKGERSDTFQHDNPYSAVEVSELFGPHGNIPNPPFTAQDLWPDPKPNIFFFAPRSVDVGQEVMGLVGSGTRNKTSRWHAKEPYESLFGGIWLSRPQDILLLLFSLDTPERVPAGYEDLLPRPWAEIESALQRGETVELGGKARAMNVILLAAPTSSGLKALVPNSKLLRALGGAGPVSSAAPTRPPALPQPAAEPAKLPDGVTVELLGVCEYPSTGKRWWRPDGSALDAAPYQTVNNQREPKEGFRDYELVVRYGGAPEMDYQWDVPGSASTGTTGHPCDAGGEPIPDLTVCIVRFPQAQTVTDVRVATAAGPWETRATHTALEREGSYPLEGGKAVAFGIPYTRDGVTFVPVTTDFFSRDMAFRIVAMRGQEEIDTGGMSGFGGNTLNSLTYRFKCPVSDIQELRFQTRPWAWTTFPNVSLRPGGRTEVRTGRTPAESGETPPAPAPREARVLAIGPACQALEDAVGGRYGGSVGGFSTNESKCAGYLKQVLSWTRPGDTFVLLLAFDKPAAVPASYQDLLPLPWSEIESRVRKGEQLETRGTARGLNVVLLATPTLAELNTLVRQTPLLAAFRSPACEPAKAPGTLEFRVVPKRDELEPDVVETYTNALREGRTPADSHYLWVMLRPGASPPPDGVVRQREGKTWLLVYNEESFVMTPAQGWRLANVGRSTDNNGRPMATLQFDEQGAERMARLTQAHSGRPLAILVHGVVVSAPTVLEGHTLRVAAIPGNFTEGEFESLMATLRKDIDQPQAEGPAPGGPPRVYDVLTDASALSGTGQTPIDRRVVLPEADRGPVVLDLATGELVPLPPAGPEPMKLQGALRKLGKGDLLYDVDLGDRTLILLRDATSVQIQGDTGEPSIRGYPIGPRLPELLTVTTAEGRRYQIAILAADSKACTLRYTLMSRNESVSSSTPTSSGKGSAAVSQGAAAGLGPVGRCALSFDGVDDKLVVPPGASLTLKPPFFIEVWAKPDFSMLPERSPGRIPDEEPWPEMSLIRQGDELRGADSPSRAPGGSDTDGWRVPRPSFVYDLNSVQSGGFMGFLLRRSGGLFAVRQDGRVMQANIFRANEVPAGHPGWSHYYSFCIRDYLPEDYVPAAASLVMGGRIVPNGFAFKGEIAEVRLWNKVLSVEEMQRYEAISLTGNEPNLVACWDFERQAGGQVVYDLTPNHNDARLGNGAGKDDADPTWVDLSNVATDQDAKQARDRGVINGSSGATEKTLKQLLDEARPGGVVMIPRGRYTTPVEINKPLVLRGESQEGCVIEVTADQPAVLINAGGRGDVTVENLTIQWQLATDKRIERPTALWVKDTNARIRNCRFEPLGDARRSPTAIFIEGRSNSTVDNCRFRGFEYTVCYGPNTQGVVQDCIITDCGHQGVINYAGATLTVQRCVITGSKFHAVRCTGGTLNVKDNLLIKNANRGIYLGNKTGRGTITNNVILGNGSGISGFGRAEYGIANNVIMDNQYAGIDMRDSCRFTIRNNVLVKNQRGLVLFKEDTANSNVVGKNTFWSNATDVENFDKPAESLTADPQFADPNRGDFTVGEPAREQGQGLTDPQVIRQLWQRYEQLQRDRPAATATPTRGVPPSAAPAQAPVPPREPVGGQPSGQPEDALKRLLDAAQPGAVVTIPRGWYTTPVEIGKPVVLRGESQEGCVIEVTADQPAVLINTDGRGDVTVENLTIQWQRATDKRIERPTALLVKDTNVRIRNCRFVPLGDARRSPTAVYIEGRSNSTVDNCRFNGFEYTVCYGPNTQGIVQDCIITDCGHQGVINYAGATLTVQRCVITGSKFHAVRCTGGTLNVKDNLLIKNANRGIYLGNKTGRGTITNNVILGNGSGISGFGRAEYGIANNVIMDNQYAGIDMRDSCRLSIRNNVLVKNQRGLVLFKEGTANSNAVGKNAYWGNATDVENLDKPAESLTADPQFADPNRGDFTVRGSVQSEGQGLTNPEVIKQLWAKYEQLQHERPTQPAGRTESTSVSPQTPSAGARTSTPSPAPTPGPGPIQQRINEAAPGATVRLEPGLYKESLLINKPLTLEGAGWGKTVIVKERMAVTSVEDIERLIAQRMAAAQTDAQRQEIAAQVKKELAERLSPLALTVENARDVVIRGIKFTSPGGHIKGGSMSVPLLKFDHSRVHLSDCAVIGGPGPGVHILNGSGAEIERTLVAAVWGTGIIVGPGPSESGVRIHDCDIRNCHYACLGIGKDASNTVVERCRIWGAAWHGIRYDAASPQILGNLLYGHARFGIYASGQTAATVRNNLFYANEMTGMACWFQTRDLIEGNTFVSNKEANLAILGASRPDIRRNIFYGSPVGISLGNINKNSPFAKSDGTVALQDNLFWLTDHEMQLRRHASTTEILAVGEDTGTVRLDPGFTAPESKDFSLRADSPARAKGIGAADLLPFDSPWPLQPEELAIIPKGDTRDSRQWRQPS